MKSILTLYHIHSNYSHCDFYGTSPSWSGPLDNSRVTYQNEPRVGNKKSCSFPCIPLSNTNQDNDTYCTFFVLQLCLSGHHSICFWLDDCIWVLRLKPLHGHDFNSFCLCPFTCASLSPPSHPGANQYHSVKERIQIHSYCYTFCPFLWLSHQQIVPKLRGAGVFMLTHRTQHNRANQALD